MIINKNRAIKTKVRCLLKKKYVSLFIFSEITEEVEENEKYPIPGEEGEFYESKLDVENAEIFGQYKFLDACVAMGITTAEKVK